MNPATPQPLRAHDSASLARFAVDQFQSSLLRYASRLLGDPERARDVVQDTFVRLMAQPVEAVEDHLAEWLFTVCRNRAFDVNRKEGRMKFFDDGEAESVVAAGPRPGAGIEARETHDAVLQMIELLPPNQQEVLRLKFQNGFSYKQISRITSLSVSNVGFLLHTAIKRLRAEWATTAESSSYATRPSRP